MPDHLAHCRLCGSSGKTLVIYQSKIFDQGATFYTCANSQAFKGTCCAPVYFTAETWNADQDGASRDAAALDSIRNYLHILEHAREMMGVFSDPALKVGQVQAEEAIRYITTELVTLRNRLRGRDEEVKHNTSLAPGSFQRRSDQWMRMCFADEVTDDPRERNRRVAEEVNELLQACGMSREEAHYMVDYTFDRKIGDPFQEMGGALVALCALGTAHGIDVLEAGERELSRIWTKVDAIRKKWQTKPKFTDLTETLLSNMPLELREVVRHHPLEKAREILFPLAEAEAAYPEEVEKSLVRLKERLTDLDEIAEYTPVVRTWYEKDVRYTVTPQVSAEDLSLNDTCCSRDY